MTRTINNHFQLLLWGKKGSLDIMLTVDKKDGSWKGNEGVVTTILDSDKLKCDHENENGVAVVCGPPIMMKFATLKLLEIGYAPENIFLSIEKNMSCGIDQPLLIQADMGHLFSKAALSNQIEFWLWRVHQIKPGGHCFGFPND